MEHTKKELYSNRKNGISTANIKGSDSSAYKSCFVASSSHIPLKAFTSEMTKNFPPKHHSHLPGDVKGNKQSSTKSAASFSSAKSSSSLTSSTHTANLTDSKHSHAPSITRRYNEYLASIPQHTSSSFKDKLSKNIDNELKRRSGVLNMIRGEHTTASKGSATLLLSPRKKLSAHKKASSYPKSLGACSKCGHGGGYYGKTTTSSYKGAISAKKNVRKLKRKTKTRRKRRKKMDGRRLAASEAIKREVPLSRAMALLLGKNKLSRPQLTKEIWEYAKSHHLIDPEDGRRILCDSKLKCVFEDRESVHMFELSSLLVPHMLYHIEDDRMRECETEAAAQRPDLLLHGGESRGRRGSVGEDYEGERVDFRGNSSVFSQESRATLRRERVASRRLRDSSEGDSSSISSSSSSVSSSDEDEDSRGEDQGSRAEEAQSKAQDEDSSDESFNSDCFESDSEQQRESVLHAVSCDTSSGDGVASLFTNIRSSQGDMTSDIGKRRRGTHKESSEKSEPRRTSRCIFDDNHDHDYGGSSSIRNEMQRSSKRRIDAYHGSSLSGRHSGVVRDLMEHATPSSSSRFHTVDLSASSNSSQSSNNRLLFSEGSEVCAGLKAGSLKLPSKDHFIKKESPENRAYDGFDLLSRRRPSSLAASADSSKDVAVKQEGVRTSSWGSLQNQKGNASSTSVASSASLSPFSDLPPYSFTSIHPPINPPFSLHPSATPSSYFRPPSPPFAKEEIPKHSANLPSNYSDIAARYSSVSVSSRNPQKTSNSTESLKNRPVLEEETSSFSPSSCASAIIPPAAYTQFNEQNRRLHTLSKRFEGRRNEAMNGLRVESDAQREAYEAVSSYSVEQLNEGDMSAADGSFQRWRNAETAASSSSSEASISAALSSANTNLVEASHACDFSTHTRDPLTRTQVPTTHTSDLPAHTPNPPINTRTIQHYSLQTGERRRALTSEGTDDAIGEALPSLPLLESTYTDASHPPLGSVCYENKGVKQGSSEAGSSSTGKTFGSFTTSLVKEESGRAQQDVCDSLSSSSNSFKTSSERVSPGFEKSLDDGKKQQKQRKLQLLHKQLDEHVKSESGSLDLHIADIEKTSLQVIFKICVSPVAAKAFLINMLAFRVAYSPLSEGEGHTFGCFPVKMMKVKESEEETLLGEVKKDRDFLGIPQSAEEDDEPGKMLYLPFSVTCERDSTGGDKGEQSFILRGSCSVSNLIPSQRYRFYLQALKLPKKWVSGESSEEQEDEDEEQDSPNSLIVHNIAAVDVMQRHDISLWSVQEVCLFIRSLHFKALAVTFEEYAVDGRSLLQLKESDLDALGLRGDFLVKKVLQAIQRLSFSPKSIDEDAKIGIVKSEQLS